MITFFAPCIPPKTTSQQKRAARTSSGIRFFKGKNQVAAEGTIKSVLLPHQPAEPIAGMVSLEVEATWPWRASDLNAKAKRILAVHSKRLPSGSKPDADNFVKSLMDALVALRFIERDELVWELTVRKYFGETPGVKVTIRGLGEIQ